MKLLRSFIKEKRRETGLTQADLAQKAGVSLRMVRDFEQGRRAVRTDNLEKLLRLFGKTLGVADLPKT